MELQFKDLKIGQEYIVNDTLIVHSPITKRKFELNPNIKVFVRNIFNENNEIKVELLFFKGWITYLIGEPEDYTGLKTID